MHGQPGLPDRGVADHPVEATTGPDQGRGGGERSGGFLAEQDDAVLAACLNACLLYWQLRKQDIFTPQPGWKSFLLRLVIAVLVMAAALVGMLYVMPEWSLGTMPYRLLRLMAVVGVGVVAYFATLALLGFKLKEFARRTA